MQPKHCLELNFGCVMYTHNSLAVLCFEHSCEHSYTYSPRNIHLGYGNTRKYGSGNPQKITTSYYERPLSSDQKNCGIQTILCGNSEKKKDMKAKKYQDIPLLSCITIKYKLMGENALMIPIQNLRDSLVTALPEVRGQGHCPSQGQQHFQTT